ncbi:MAG: hypothetical protein NWE94_00890 [Candidatus Bathyarchaeota archaeon]|nr:hypothetical protein [Candidatus Bathyarchaeota archaeon]
MQKSAVASVLIFALLFSVVAVSPMANSEVAPTYAAITIKSDGSVEGTDKIQRQGNVYTFTGDIFGSITVRRSRITIDGAGHTLQGRREANERGINLVGHDETFSAYGNVLVKNLRIYNFLEGIFTPSNNNSFIGNCFDHAGIHILGGNNTGNVIKHNTFIEGGIFVDYNNGGLDVITENNFINSTIFVDLSKPPIVDRNYWSNYTAEYPNAKEVGNSGIWDTPYVYDKYVGGSHGDYPRIDYNPLTLPVAVPAFPDTTAPVVAVVSPENKTYTSGNVSLAFTVDDPVAWAGYSLDGAENVTITGNITLTELAIGVHRVVVYANDTFGNMAASETVTFTVAPPISLPSAHAVAIVVAVAVACVGFFVYFKKHGKVNNS